LKLYKYRTLGTELQYALDILVNERLYCADYRKLNDPLEGVHRLAEEQHSVAGLGRFVVPEEIRELQSLATEGAAPPRVCSLSGSADHFLLWSHYADGHRGVAVEVDLEVTFAGPLHPVKYAPDLPSYTRTILGGATARDVLFHKTKHWAHEREHRVVQNDEFFNIAGRITSLLLGTSIDPRQQELLERVVPHAIPIHPTTIDWKNLRIVKCGPLRR
jgi:hypothetical protein